jgi:hypothetical protein
MYVPAGASAEKNRRNVWARKRGESYQLVSFSILTLVTIRLTGEQLWLNAIKVERIGTFSGPRSSTARGSLVPCYWVGHRMFLLA